MKTPTVLPIQSDIVRTTRTICAKLSDTEHAKVKKRLTAARIRRIAQIDDNHWQDIANNLERL